MLRPSGCRKSSHKISQDELEGGFDSYPLACAAKERGKDAREAPHNLRHYKVKGAECRALNDKFFI